jgi:hypothetical protein
LCSLFIVSYFQKLFQGFTGDLWQSETKPHPNQDKLRPLVSRKRVLPRKLPRLV